MEFPRTPQTSLIHLFIYFFLLFNAFFHFKCYITSSQPFLMLSAISAERISRICVSSELNAMSHFIISLRELLQTNKQYHTPRPPCRWPQGHSNHIFSFSQVLPGLHYIRCPKRKNKVPLPLSYIFIFSF